MNDKNYLFSTAKSEKLLSNKIIINAVKIREELIRKEELKITKKPKTKFDIFCFMRFLYLIFKSIFNLSIFGRKFLNLKYKKVRIGKYAISCAFRNILSYEFKFVYFYFLVRAVYACLYKIDKFLEIKDSVLAMYVNETSYQNGVYRDLAIIYKIPFYTNGFPFDLVRFSGANNLQLDEYNLLNTKPSVDLERGKKKLMEIINETKKIPHMSGINFDNIDHGIDFSDVYAVIYAHSFTDSQQEFCIDKSFINILDWLKFTVENLKDKKIIIKAHPAFFAEGYKTMVVAWDKKIWYDFVSKYSKNRLIQIIDWPMRNLELLKRLPKETLLISHHGNALLEGGGLGFNCICSTAAPWKKFNLFNSWISRDDYFSMLNKEIKLKETNLKDIYQYVANLYFGKNSYASLNSWNRIVAHYAGINFVDFIKNPYQLNQINNLDINIITNEISENIKIHDFTEYN